MYGLESLASLLLTWEGLAEISELCRGQCKTHCDLPSTHSVTIVALHDSCVAMLCDVLQNIGSIGIEHEMCIWRWPCLRKYLAMSSQNTGRIILQGALPCNFGLVRVVEVLWRTRLLKYRRWIACRVIAIVWRCNGLSTLWELIEFCRKRKKQLRWWERDTTTWSTSEAHARSRVIRTMIT